ncbi:MAG TPA: PKD domain-containing protein [Methanospirillum sp.]|uniref:PKD domain-containing protein n=1 Tax=Methanospirillum sp. TaxID=45200 RepID=UPI002BB6A52A|nr:PKD domain-containing protein [Methanospirillum sp.]HWQ64088.1 PKD domain-containing protein [Methanospirillum sp.]
MGIISGVSLADSSSIVSENGHQSVIADFRAGALSGAAPVAVQFTDISLGSPDEWYWDFGDGTHDTGQNPLHIYTSPGIYSVSLSVTGPAGSDMKTRLGYVKVSEAQVSTRSKEPVQTISPKMLSFPTSTPTNTPTELLTPLPTESPVSTPIPTSTSDIGTSETHLLELLTPGILADFTPSVNGGLAPLAVRFTDNSSGNPTSWSWDFGDGTSSDLASPEHVYTLPGKYKVRLTVKGNQGSNTTESKEPIEVAVMPEASVKAQPKTGSAPLMVAFTDNSTGRINSWLWTFGDGTSSDEQNPVHTYNRAGVYDVSLTISGPDGGANAAIPAMVTVTDLIEPPVAIISTDTTVGAAPLLVRFTDTSTGDVTTRTWDFGDGGSGAESDITHTFTKAGTYTTRLTIKGPAGESHTEKVIVVNEPLSVPKAGFSTDIVSGDAPLTVSFMDMSSGSISSYNWIFGDSGSSHETNPIHTYSSPGSYQAVLTVSGPGGSSHSEKGIIVSEPAVAPVSSFTPDISEGIAPLSVSFIDMSTGNISSWNWSFGDGSSSADKNPVHTYSAAGSYQAVLTVSGPGGSSHSEKGIIVSEPTVAPVSSFNPDISEGIAPLSVSFTDVSTGNISSWNWSFGDGSSSSEKNPTHTYSSSGSYQTVLTVSGPGGSSHSEKGIIVHEPAVSPVSSFTPDVSEGIAPLSVSFTDMSTGNISSWNWSFGDGSSSSDKNPVHTYSAAGSYHAVLTVSGPGGSSHSEKGIIVSEPITPLPTSLITPAPVVSSTPSVISEPQKLLVTPAPAVKKKPVAKFSTANNEGSAPLTVRFRDTSVGEISSWKWDFGDGTGISDQNPSHTYTKPGNYAASLTITTPEGSQKSDISMILVTSSTSMPKAVITADPKYGTAPLTISFIDASTGAVSTRNWNFGDGTTSSDLNPVHTYQNPGVYTTSLIVKGPAGESRTDEQIVVSLKPEPTPSLAVESPTSALIIPHSDNEVPETQPVQLSTITPKITELPVIPEIIPTKIQEKPEPVSESHGILITTDRTVGSAPLTVSFTSNSAMKADRYEWLFGDGSSSEEEHPTHTYDKPGTYDLTLLLDGPDGQGRKVLPAYITVTEPVSTRSEQPTISAPLLQPIPTQNIPPGPTAAISVDTINGTAPLKVSFQAVPSGKIDGYAWDFGDGGTSYEQNPMYTYGTAGNYSVKLVVAGENGSDEIRLKSTITVLEGIKTPVCGFTATPVSGYAPLNVSFSDTSSGSINQYEWSLGDGTSSSDKNPSHLYSEPGVYTVGLQVSGQAGNAAEIKKDLITVDNVPAAPVARFKSDKRSGTAPLEIHFQDLSSGVVSEWNWDLGDGTISEEKDPVMTYTRAGVYAVTETVTGPGGKDVAVRRGYITVSEPQIPPTAIIYAEPVGGSAPLTVKFLDMSTGLVTGWNWDLGDGSISTNKNPTHIYQSEGTYSVNLHVSGPDGENSTTTVIRVSPHEKASEKLEMKNQTVDSPLIPPVSSGTVTNESFSNVTMEDPDLPTSGSEKPVAAFSLSGRSGKSPLTISFHDRSSGQITGWQWVFGDGDTSDLKEPTHTYEQPGVYTVALSVTGPDGTSQKRIREAVQVI